MDPNKFSAKERKVAGTTGVKIVKTYYLNNNYKIKVFSDNPATDSGLVIIAELSPKNPLLLRFLFRWDEKAGVLDVDIYRNKRLCNELWKKGGHSGHHPQKIAGKDRIFKVDISIPDKNIFKGEIDVGLFMAQRLSICMKSIPTLVPRVIRKNQQ